jgi:AcrR family transcriptional regulator
VLDAFIALVADDGLEAVTLDRVAREAGVQRAVIRHFVGNRAELVKQAVGRIAERYEADIRALLGSRPGPDDLLDALFGDPWVTGFTRYDRAFDALLLEGARDPGTAAELRRAYATLLDEIAAVLHRQAPGADGALVRETAYAVLCLAEHNATMISLGHPPELSVAARRAAADLAARVLGPGPPG